MAKMSNVERIIRITEDTIYTKTKYATMGHGRATLRSKSWPPCKVGDYVRVTVNSEGIGHMVRVRKVTSAMRRECARKDN
jgi:hypothetical protein